jgi:hypothetical protein
MRVHEWPSDLIELDSEKLREMVTESWLCTTRKAKFDVRLVPEGIHNRQKLVQFRSFKQLIKAVDEEADRARAALQYESKDFS